MTLDELRAAVHAAAEDLRAVHEEIGENAPSDEQRAKWDEAKRRHADAKTAFERAETEANERRTAIAGLPERRTEAGDGGRGAPQVMRRVETGPVEVRTLSQGEARDRALAVLDTREARHLRSDQKEQVERLLETRNGNTNGDYIARLLVATESPHYRSAFQKIAAGRTFFSEDEARAIQQVNELRAMSIGTDASGGYGVPVLIDPTIILTSQGSPNDILRLARVETITNDEWKGVSSAGVSWQFSAEAAATTDNSPTLAQPSVTTRRADGFIPFSIEVGMDYPGFAMEMSALLNEGYDELLAHKLTTGTSGSNEPIGLITRLDATTTIEREVATAGTIAAADIYALWDLLPVRFRRNRDRCAWMSSTDVQNSIRQLGTVDPNFTVNLTQEAIPALFGRQFPANEYMQDDPSGTGTQALLVVGDFSYYLVAQRAGMSVEFVPHLFDVTNNRPTGQRGWFAWARIGADTISTNAFRLLVNKSA